jgi:hypothetical protein
MWEVRRIGGGLGREEGESQLLRVCILGMGEGEGRCRGDDCCLKE